MLTDNRIEVLSPVISGINIGVHTNFYGLLPTVVRCNRKIPTRVMFISDMPDLDNMIQYLSKYNINYKVCVKNECDNTHKEDWVMI